MKKLMLLILSLALLVSLVGCGKKNDSSADAGTTESTADTQLDTGSSGPDGTESTDTTDSTTDTGNSTETPGEGTSQGGTTTPNQGSQGNASQGGHTHTVVTDAAVAATCQKTGLTEGSHCSTCKQVITAQKEVAKTSHRYTYTFTADKHTLTCAYCNDQKTEAHTLTSGGTACTGCSFKKETPPKFSTGYYSSQKTYIETDYVIFEIEPNVYIIGDLVAYTDEICRALENATGLKFNNAQYGGKKILLHVDNPEPIREGSEMSGNNGYAVAGASRSSRGDDCMHYVYLPSPHCLFTDQSTTFIHELAHALRFCQSSADFTTLLEEGFAEYVTYKTVLYLEKQKSAAGFLLSSSTYIGISFEMYDFNYAQKDLTYWLGLPYESFGKMQYPLGCNLMAYLEAKFGNYTNWAKANVAGALTGQAEMQLLQSLYGNNFADGFYAWIKANPITGEAYGHFYNPYSQRTIDLTGYGPLSFYASFPNYATFTCAFSPHSFKYKDLYINLEEAKHFLRDYKGRNIDNLYLTLSDSVTVQYFDKNGVMLMESKEKLVDVRNVSYIKLVGSGYLGKMELVGYYDPNMSYKDGQVIFTGTVDDASDGHSELLTTADVSEAMQFAWDTELAYSKAYTLILQLSDDCCEITTYDRTWTMQTITGKREIVISDLRYFQISNPSNTPVTAKIIVMKTSR